MKIDVSALLKSVGAEQDVSRSEKLSFKEDNLTLTSPVEVDLKLLNTGPSVLILGGLKTKAKLNCCRCLKDFELPVSIEIEEQYRKTPPVSREYKEDEEIELKEKDFFFEIGENNVIDLDEMIRQNIIVALPIKPLCSKACKGIKGMEVANVKVPDPRLAKLGRLVLRSKTKGER